MPKRIPLHGKHGEGKFAIVDEEDFLHLSAMYWKLAGNGYVYREMRPVEGVRGARAMHHEVLGITDPDYKRPVDHKNRNPLDNRRSNLRRTTTGINAMNKSRSGRKGATGIKYVHPIKGWTLQT